MKLSFTDSQVKVQPCKVSANWSNRYSEQIGAWLYPVGKLYSCLLRATFSEKHRKYLEERVAETNIPAHLLMLAPLISTFRPGLCFGSNWVHTAKTNWYRDKMFCLRSHTGIKSRKWKAHFIFCCLSKHIASLEKKLFCKRLLIPSRTSWISKIETIRRSCATFWAPVWTPKPFFYVLINLIKAPASSGPRHDLRSTDDWLMLLSVSML